MDYPSDWTEDSARKAERHSYFDAIIITGWMLDGGCYAFLASPAGDAYLEVAMHDSPLPLTVDRLFPWAPFFDMFPGYEVVCQGTIDEQGLKAINVFTCDDGKAEQFIVVSNSPPQAWYVTCMSTEETFDAYESTFLWILSSFTFLS